MGFQTVATKKRADEIQKVLSAVKAELPNTQGAGEVNKAAQYGFKDHRRTCWYAHASNGANQGWTAIGSLSEADELLGIDDDGDEAEAKDEGRCTAGE